LSGRGLCDELITRPEESYRLWCVVVCDLETSRIGAPYIYDISRLRVNLETRCSWVECSSPGHFFSQGKNPELTAQPVWVFWETSNRRKTLKWSISFAVYDLFRSLELGWHYVCVEVWFIVGPLSTSQIANKLIWSTGGPIMDSRKSK